MAGFLWHALGLAPAPRKGFGIGWGIGGYCPGPALTALSNLTVEAFAFVAAMIAGGLVHGFFERSRLPAAYENT